MLDTQLQPDALSPWVSFVDSLKISLALPQLICFYHSRKQFASSLFCDFLSLSKFFHLSAGNNGSKRSDRFFAKRSGLGDKIFYQILIQPSIVILCEISYFYLLFEIKGIWSGTLYCNNFNGDMDLIDPSIKITIGKYFHY